MAMTGKIKVCLAGAGVWGWQHARVFSERPDVTLCAVAGRNREKTEARAAEFGLRAYTNLPEMLDKEKPDLVSLSLPNLEHFQATLEVIQAGYPLLAEKPLVFDLAEADRLLAEAKKRKVFFASANNRSASARSKTNGFSASKGYPAWMTSRVAWKCSRLGKERLTRSGFSLSNISGRFV